MSEVELHAQLAALRAELAKWQKIAKDMTEAVGLATTCAPDMLIDSTKPVEMMQEVCNRFDLLTAENERLTMEVGTARNLAGLSTDLVTDLRAQLVKAELERDELVRRVAYQDATIYMSGGGSIHVVVNAKESVLVPHTITFGKLMQQLAASEARCKELKQERDRSEVESASANQETSDTLFAGIQERDVKIQTLEARVKALEKALTYCAAGPGELHPLNQAQYLVARAALSKETL